MRRLITYLTIIIFITTMGCTDKNTEAPQKKFVLETGRPLNIVDGTMDSWIILSDTDGNPIKVIDTDNFYEEVNYNPDEANLNWVTVVNYFFNDEMVDISTIKFVDGLDTLSVYYRPLPKTYSATNYIHNSDEGDAYIDISSLSATVFELSVGSRGYLDYFQLYNNLDTKDIMPFTLPNEFSDCFVTVQDAYEFEPKYLFTSNVQKGDTLKLEPSSLKAYDGGFNINLPRYSPNIRKTIGIKNSYEEYCTFFSKYSDKDVFPVRYIENSFDSYLTYIYYSIVDEKRSVGFWQKSDTPLGNFDLISNTFELTSNNDGKLEYNYSGVSDLLFTRWIKDNDYSRQWYIISDPNDSYVMRPVIPETILDQIPGSENFDFQLESASFYEYSFLNSYEDAISYGHKKFPDEYSYYGEYFDFY